MGRDDASLPPETRIGHVHLRVADIERSLAFYCDILGFQVKERWGSEAAFIAAGDYHHHIGLNTWHSKGASPPPAGHTGLFHHAILFPDRRSLGQALARLTDHDWPLTGAADHGVSEALYLDDPDGNGVELYRDRPPDEWPRDPDGNLRMFSEPLDLGALLDEGRT